jgi:hypothetical protein
MGRRMSWLIRKPGGTYWFRRGVPAKLRDIVGKREILVSLNTKDPAVAKKRAVAEAAEAERVLDIHLSTQLEHGDLDATKRAIFEGLLKRDQNGGEDNPPLSIVFDRWCAERKPPAKTWQEWDGARRRFSETVGADLPVRGITKGHVRAFKDALLSAPSRRTGRPTSPATARRSRTRADSSKRRVSTRASSSPTCRTSFAPRSKPSSASPRC